MIIIVTFEQYHRILRVGTGSGEGRTLVVAFADSHGQSTRLTIILCSQHVVVIIVADLGHEDWQTLTASQSLSSSPWPQNLQF